MMSTPTASKPDSLGDIFPVRFKIYVPPEGLGILFVELQIWLTDRFGKDGFGRERSYFCGHESESLYFHSMEDGQEFLNQFKQLKLAAASLYKPIAEEKKKIHFHIGSDNIIPLKPASGNS